jgi:uncharacterized membrane protein
MAEEGSENLPREIETILEEADQKIFQSIAPNERPKVARLVRVVSQRYFSGPLPPPEILAQYDDIVPGSAKLIFAMVEKQSAHRILLEDRTNKAQTEQSGRGQWMAFVVAMAFLGGSLWISHDGYPAVGAVLGGATVVSLATAFILGKRGQQRDLEQERPGGRRKK